VPPTMHILAVRSSDRAHESPARRCTFSSRHRATPATSRARACCSCIIITLLLDVLWPVVARADGELDDPSVEEAHGITFRQQLDEYVTRAAARATQDVAAVSSQLDLTHALYVRARFTGSRNDLLDALGEAGECIRRGPSEAACFLVRARLFHALSVLTEARADAVHAGELGADPEKVAPIVAEIDWAEARYTEAARVIRGAAAAHPTMENLARRARLEHDLGHYPLADYLFTRAAEALGGDDAIRRGWLDAHRAACARELGKLAMAESLLLQSLERLPGYPFALVQLARTLVARGELREATRQYRKLLGLALEPEYVGELAAVHRRRGRLIQADALNGEAARLFEEGLRRYPEAVRAGAANFYLGEGNDVTRALRLLEEDGARSDDAFLELRARAYLAAGDIAKAESAIRAALMLAPLSLQTLRTADNTFRALAEASQ
jgi:tetratricopeptide (TPR) repeat protein